VPAMEFPIYAGIFKFRNARFLLYQKQCETHWAKIVKISLRGNKSIRAAFDSQVVRLDVIAPRSG